MAFVKKWGMTSFCLRAFTLQINVTYFIILTFIHFLLPYKINEMDPITSLVYSIALIIQYTLYKITSGFEFQQTACWSLNTVVVAMLLSKCFFLLFIKKDILCSTHSKRTEQSLSKRWPGLSSLWKEQFFVWHNYY